MKNNKHYTHEEVLGAFQEEVANFKNQIARIPSRDNSRGEVERYAKEIFKERYKDALHLSVLDQYKGE